MLTLLGEWGTWNGASQRMKCGVSLHMDPSLGEDHGETLAGLTPVWVLQEEGDK